MTAQEQATVDMSTREHFEENMFMVLPNLLDPLLVEFLSSYYSTMGEAEDGEFGRDRTSLNGYGDACADAVMYMLREKLEEATGIELVPAFSFVRHYKKGDKLGRHNDRPSNQINCTITINQDTDWPIGFCHKFGGTEYILKNEPGTGVCYWGNELEHWREKYTGESQVQLITGFIVKGGKFDTEEFRFDGRGRPTYTPSFVDKTPASRVMKRRLYVAWRNLKHKLGLTKDDGLA